MDRSRLAIHSREHKDLNRALNSQNHKPQTLSFPPIQTKNFQLRDVLRTHENIRNASKEKIVKKISKETGPCCLKKLTTIVLHMKDGNVYILKQMGNTDISRVTAIMESVFFKEDWKRKHIVSNEHMKNTFGTSKF